MFHESHKQIHAEIKEHSPKTILKVKKLVSFKYPKTLLLIVLSLLAYYLFSSPLFSNFANSLNNLGYFAVFFSGILTSIGFTAPFGIGILANIHVSNLFLSVILGSLGASIADLLIFKTVKFSFMDEFHNLEKTKVMKEIEKIVKKNKHVIIVHYALYLFAGILFTLPIPDEIAVSLIAGTTTIKPFALVLVSFFFHTISIFLMMSLL